MANKGIKNKVFGSDTPIIIKKKVEARQILNFQNKNPNESIQSSYGGLDSTFGELNNASISDFTGIADLSSKTPVARMWTAVNIAKDIKTENTKTYDNKKDIKEWNEERDKKINMGGSEAKKWENRYLKDLGNSSFEERELVDLSDSRRIYTVGNHELNTLEIGPNQERQGTKIGNDISAAVMTSVLPFEQETDRNMFFKPPAGITGITSETEGPLGAIKKTTVNFIVHNFSDFEKIYLRYFLKPGALVFIDFGWDTGLLYKPEDLIKDASLIDDVLYGDTGYVTLSKGDLETLYGHVVNYDAKNRDDGGFDCSVEIVSKNAVLLSSDVDTKIRDNISKRIDQEIIASTVTMATKNDKFYEEVTAAGKVPESIEAVDKQTKHLGAVLFGGSNVKLPGDNTFAASRLASEYGVFVYSPRGPNDKKTVYVNFGWFEDNFLNREFGFSDKPKNLINKNSDSTKNDENSTFAKFNSRNSFITYDESLLIRMRNMQHKRMSFIYPLSWGGYKNTPTYNTKIGMIPDGRFISSAGEYWMETSEGEDLVAEGRIEDFDRHNNQIPIREIFISTEIIKDSIKNSTDVMQFIKGIITRISEDSSECIDLGLTSNSYGQHTLSIVDNNSLVIGKGDSFFKKLLLFKPYSPDTIVKNYELSFSMPQGGLSDIIAIQSTANLKDIQSVSSLIDAFVDLDTLDRTSDLQNKFVRNIPSPGTIASSRLKKKLQEDGSSVFGFSKDELVYSTEVDNSSHINTSDTINQVFRDKKIEDLNYKDYVEESRDAIRKGINFKESEVAEAEREKKERKKTKKKSIDQATEATELAKKQNYELVKNPALWFYKIAQKASVSITPAILPIEAGLTIYGIAGFSPGDLIRINYLPKRYYDSVYFQVIQVSHDVGNTWSTTLTTQMRIIPKNKKIGKINENHKDKVRVKKTFLQDINLKQIDNYMELFDNLTPLEPQIINGKMPLEIDHIFRTTHIRNAVDINSLNNTEIRGRHALPGQIVKVIGGEEQFKDKLTGLARKISDIQGPIGSFTVRIQYMPVFDWFGWKLFGGEDKAGFRAFLENVNEDQPSYIVTAGENWLMVPFDPSSNWVELEEFFREVKIVDPSEYEVPNVEGTEEPSWWQFWK